MYIVANGLEAQERLGDSSDDGENLKRSNSLSAKAEHTAVVVKVMTNEANGRKMKQDATGA